MRSGQIMSLEEAAELLSLDKGEKRLKTKVRRLYDIANIFRSMGMISKVRTRNSKPAYRWEGIQGIR